MWGKDPNPVCQHFDGPKCIFYKKHETRIKISDEEFSRIKIKPKRFHGDWNYTILNNKNPSSEPCYLCAESYVFQKRCFRSDTNYQQEIFIYLTLLYLSVSFILFYQVIRSKNGILVNIIYLTNIGIYNPLINKIGAM